MKATLRIPITTREIPPDSQTARVAWLDKYGPPPRTCTFVIEAELSEYHALGIDVGPYGTLNEEGEQEDSLPLRALREACHSAVLRYARETGAIPSVLPEPVRLVAFADASRLLRISREAAEDRQAQARAKRTERIAAAQAAAAAVTVDSVLATHRYFASDDGVRGAVLSIAGVPQELSDAIEIDPGLIAAARQRGDESLRQEKLALDQLLADVLTPEQYERWRAGVLPEGERAAAVEQELYRAVELPLFEPLDFARFEHRADCRQIPDEKWECLPPGVLPQMDVEAFRRWKALQAAFSSVPRGAAVSYRFRVHRLLCGCSDIKYGLHVSLRFGGHIYLREYAIS